MAYGQSADENQVSSTSGSRSSSAEPHSAHAFGGGHAQVTWPSGQYQSGCWWPHQSCREMFQSGISSSERIANWCCDSGWKRTRRSWSAASAGLRGSSIATHHCSETSGSIRVWQRSQVPTACR